MKSENILPEELTIIIDRLIDKNINDNYMGYDPYDFSNSTHKIFSKQNTGIFAKLSYLNKVSIINFRPILKIPKTNNSKAKALFLNALILYNSKTYKKEIENLYNWFIDNQPLEFQPYFSSGFAFKISMTGYTSGPAKTSLIISLFTAYALVNLYRKTNRSDVLNHLLSLKTLIEEKLPYFEDSETLHYSYHFDRFDETYNATAKIGKFYSLIYRYVSPDNEDKIKIKKILNYLSQKQRSDGSWPYSNALDYSDSFHTAFILESIYHMLEVYDDECSFKKMFIAGLEDYKMNFFKNDSPIHFHKKHNRTGGRSIIGVELRDCANAIILFTSVNDYIKASELVRWTLHNMFSDNKVFFYRNRFWTNRIDFVRWNAWLLYALVVYYNKFHK